MLRLTPIVLATAACIASSEPNAHLADLPGFGIQTYAAHRLGDDDDALPILTVWIGYDEVAFKDTHNGDCVTLHDDVAGTFNGMPLELASAGAPFRDPGECDAPVFETRLPITTADAGDLLVFDGTATVHATYAVGALAPRRATLVSHADWQLAAGDVVIARWSHAQDLASGIEVELDNDAEPVTILADSVPGTSEISFQLPAKRPRYEQSVMMFAVAGDDATPLYSPAVTCDGAEHCTYSTNGLFAHYAWIR